jgi:NAD(P)-dependent dehydrogenase (short-subunit alcohol dehydrogenase family)
MSLNSPERRVALVTGGASGIGLATVRRLTASGARVLVADIDQAAGPVAAAAAGGRFVRTDVRDPAQLDAAVAAAERAFGGLDLAVLNAGIAAGTGDILGVDLERYRAVVGVNVDGVVLGVRAALPALRRRGGGAIVVTASLAGLVPYPADPLYALTKHAVIGLVRSLAEPLARDGVRVNCVCPGFADTPLGAHLPRHGALGEVPLLSADEIAVALLTAAASAGSGEAWVVQPGREPQPYRFRGVPGPRTGEPGGRPQDPPHPSW